MEEKDQQESFDLLCSAEWHMTRLKANYASAVYHYAFVLSKRSGRFYASIGRLAAYFNVDARQIRKAIHALAKAKFLMKLKEEPGKPVVYRPVPHKEWSARFPGKCLVKVTMPWDGEQKDPLVIQLRAASDGRLNLYPSFVKGMRNTGLSDDAIVAHWRDFYAADNPEGEKWKGVFGRFMAYLRERKIDRLLDEAEANYQARVQPGSSRA